MKLRQYFNFWTMLATNSVSSMGNLDAVGNPVTIRGNLDAIGNPVTIRGNLDAVGNPVTIKGNLDAVRNQLPSGVILMLLETELPSGVILMLSETQLVPGIILILLGHPVSFRDNLELCWKPHSAHPGPHWNGSTGMIYLNLSSENHRHSLVF
jgi:hypothetical protein